MQKKNCPYCGEEIMATAKKCKHCGEWLTEQAPVHLDPQPAQPAQPAQPVQSERPAPPAPKPAPRLSRRAEEEEDDGPSFWLGKYFVHSLVPAVFMWLGSWLLIHYGSWHLVFGKNNFLLNLIGKPGFILEEFCILLRINDGYYGFYKDNIFFDSPVIQWIMLFMGVSLFCTGIGRLFGVDIHED